MKIEKSLKKLQNSQENSYVTREDKVYLSNILYTYFINCTPNTFIVTF